MSVPWFRRFRFDWEHKDWRFSLRIVCGFFVIWMARRWIAFDYYRLESTLQIGYIPFRIEEG